MSISSVCIYEDDKFEVIKGIGAPNKVKFKGRNLEIDLPIKGIPDNCIIINYILFGSYHNISLCKEVLFRFNIIGKIYDEFDMLSFDPDDTFMSSIKGIDVPESVRNAGYVTGANGIKELKAKDAVKSVTSYGKCALFEIERTDAQQHYIYTLILGGRQSMPKLFSVKINQHIENPEVGYPEEDDLVDDYYELVQSSVRCILEDRRFDNIPENIYHKVAYFVLIAYILEVVNIITEKQRITLMSILIAKHVKDRGKDVIDEFLKILPSAFADGLAMGIQGLYIFTRIPQSAILHAIQYKAFLLRI